MSEKHDLLISGHFEAHEEVLRDARAALSGAIGASGQSLIAALEGGGKALIFGNGGSAAQASHLAAELTGRFRKNRRPLPAVALNADTGALTCIGNDFGYEEVFARQVRAHARSGDVAIGLTTSGASPNVIAALEAARASGAVRIALTGRAGLARGDADHLLRAPSDNTALVQEIHLLIIHAWCLMVDEAFA